MTFGTPEALLLALAAIPMAAALFLRRRRAAYTVPSIFGLPAIKPTLRIRLSRMLPALRILSVLLLAVAIARPRSGDANAIIPAEGIDIVLSLDTSGSMTSSQLAPGKDRLETSKDVIRDFIEGRENDRIGYVIFAAESLALSPPTLDYRALDTLVETTETGILPDGTAVGLGIAEATNMLRESDASSQIVILLTDGEDNSSAISPLEAAGLAEALNIRIYTIGVVSDPQAASQSVDEELLQEISDDTGGKYFVAASEADLKAVYDEIGTLETSRVGRERYERFTELGPWIAAAAAGVLALELLLGATWLRRNPS